jgi:hypothetical protein
MTPCNLAQNQASANQSCVNQGSLARPKLGLQLGKILQTNGSVVATEKVQVVERLKALPVLPALQHLTSLPRPCKPRIELRQK